MRPMSEFDPARPSRVHDALNDVTFVWQPDWEADFCEHALSNTPGIIEWDGRLLDGWRERDD